MMSLLNLPVYPDIPLGSVLGVAPVSDMWKYINSQEPMNHQYAQAQQAQQAQLAINTHVNDALIYRNAQQYDGSQDVSINPGTRTMAALAIRAQELFINRMKGVRDSGFKIKLTDFVACHVYEDRVYLFFMFDGKEGVVSEQIDTFPSDQLVAQFRMVLA